MVPIQLFSIKVPIESKSWTANPRAAPGAEALDEVPFPQGRPANAVVRCRLTSADPTEHAHATDRFADHDEPKET